MKDKKIATIKGGMRSDSSIDKLMNYMFRTRMDLMGLRKATNNRQKKANSYFDADDKALKVFLEMTDAISELEDKIKKKSIKYLKSHPLSWLFKKYMGIGDVLGMALLASIDIDRASTVSKIWAVCGLGMEWKYRVIYVDITLKNGKEIKRSEPKTKEVYGTSETSALNAIPMDKTIEKNGQRILVEIKREAVEIVRISDNPERQRRRTGQYPTYNNELKCIVLGNVGQGLIKMWGIYNKKGSSKKDMKYMNMFNDFRREERTKDPSKNEGWVVKLAARRTMKEFMKEFYVEYRTLKGLPVREPYSQEFMGKEPHGQRGGAA